MFLVTFNESFLHAREAYLAAKLLTDDDLEALRERVAQSLEGPDFCDGCGFCCHGLISYSALEFQRVKRLLDADPSLLRPQGAVCPFLDLDRRKFDENLRAYGQTRAPMHPMGCRIYPERPMVCRLFPAPNNEVCRHHGSLEAPDINAALLDEEDSEPDFPHLRIQKYYVTLEWERRHLPRDVLDPSIRFLLVPGWWVDHKKCMLFSKDAPDWIDGFLGVPEAFPTPRACELEPWSAELFSCFEDPSPYLPVVERFASRVKVEELARLLTQAELSGILDVVDWPRRADAGRRTIWTWLREA